jgi:hypothetical protein
MLMGIGRGVLMVVGAFDGVRGDTAVLGNTVMVGATVVVTGTVVLGVVVVVTGVVVVVTVGVVVVTVGVVVVTVGVVVPATVVVATVGAVVPATWGVGSKFSKRTPFFFIVSTMININNPNKSTINNMFNMHIYIIMNYSII